MKKPNDNRKDDKKGDHTKDNDRDKTGKVEKEPHWFKASYFGLIWNIDG